MESWCPFLVVFLGWCGRASPAVGVQAQRRSAARTNVWVPETRATAFDLLLRRRLEPGMTRRWHCG